MGADAWRMDLLATVGDLGLKDWAIGAGFVRACVWDALSGFDAPTPLADIDVLYFDPRRTLPVHERRMEARLRAARPGIPWSVKNQARMHRRNSDWPYGGLDAAMARWMETPHASPSPWAWAANSGSWRRTASMI